MDLIFGSSRGHNLSELLHASHPSPESVAIYAASSAKLKELLQEAIDQLDRADDPTNCHIYFVAGLCDITRRDEDAWDPACGAYQEITMPEGSDECARRMCELIDFISIRILYRGAKPCFSTIPPSSLEKYNLMRLKKRKTSYLLHSLEYADMQDNLMRAILHVNNHISKVNGENGMATPDLAGSVVETRAGKAPRAHFKRLYDGVHPTDKTRRKWAKRLQKAISINRRYKNPVNFDEPVSSVSDLEDAPDY